MRDFEAASISRKQNNTDLQAHDRIPLDSKLEMAWMRRENTKECCVEEERELDNRQGTSEQMQN